MKARPDRPARLLGVLTMAAGGAVGAFLIGYAIIGLIADYHAPARISAEAARRAVPEIERGADLPTAPSQIISSASTSPITNVERFPPGPLTKFEGAYSFDVIDGRTFLDEPLVTSSVKAIVADPDAGDWVLTNPVASPITRLNGYLRAWACEQHNCGPHHWTIFIDDSGQEAAVCYYDEMSNASPRWFGDDDIVRSLALAPRQSEHPGCP